MPLLRGSVSVTRFAVTHQPDEPAFGQVAFRAIEPGSEVRESVGFVPMQPEAPYRVGHRRYAFRVRIDTLRADPTAVRERLMQLVQSELEQTGAAFVGPKKRKQLKELAEEELIVNATPRSKIIECAIDGDALYVASTAKGQIGHVMVSLRKIDITVDYKAPWLDRGEDAESEIVEAREPGQSVLGCRFLAKLMGDAEILFEPESGYVRLQTRDAKVTLTGAILGDLHRYVERGAELLAAKLLTGETTFRFDAMSYRVAALRVETGRHEHWTELLDERLEKIGGVFALLDAKYKATMSG